MPTKTFITYRQFNIRQCLCVGGDERNRWYVELTASEDNGPMPERHCPHFYFMQPAMLYVDDLWATFLSKL